MKQQHPLEYGGGGLWWGLWAGAPVCKHQYQVFHFDKTISIYVTTGVFQPVFKHQQQVGDSNMEIVVGIRAHSRSACQSPATHAAA